MFLPSPALQGWDKNIYILKTIIMKIIYPENIKGATPIIGFISKNYVRVDLNVGETKELEKEVAQQLLSTFTFLEEVKEVSDIITTDTTDIDINPQITDTTDIDIKESLKNIPFSDKRTLLKEKGFQTKGISSEKADQLIIENNLLN